MISNSTRFTLPERHVIPIPKTARYQPWLPSPPTLVDLAGYKINNFPLPDCYEWDTQDVVKWLMNTIRLPQYEDCFKINKINGRRLILIDASACSQIGICDFEHIQVCTCDKKRKIIIDEKAESSLQKITEGIRKLTGVEKEKCGRSISLPPRYPWTHYLLYRAFSGPTRENTSPLEFFRKMAILDKENLCPFGHWEMITPYQPDFPCNRFGLMKRKNVYTRNEHTRQPRGHSYYKKSQLKPTYHIRVDVK